MRGFRERDKESDELMREGTLPAMDAEGVYKEMSSGSNVLCPFPETRA